MALATDKMVGKAELTEFEEPDCVDICVCCEELLEVCFVVLSTDSDDNGVGNSVVLVCPRT